MKHVCLWCAVFYTITNACNFNFVPSLLKMAIKYFLFHLQQNQNQIWKDNWIRIPMVYGSKACVIYVKSYGDLKFSDKTFAGYWIWIRYWLLSRSWLMSQFFVCFVLPLALTVVSSHLFKNGRHSMRNRHAGVRFPLWLYRGHKSSEARLHNLWQRCCNLTRNNTEYFLSDPLPPLEKEQLFNKKSTCIKIKRMYSM